MEGVNYESLLYEGYGPSGVAIMMEVMTDNKNRTIPEIRHIMSKNNGNLGESGCVSWIFEKRGTITISKKETNEDDLINDCLEFDVEDINSDDEFFEITVQRFLMIFVLTWNLKYLLEAEISLCPQILLRYHLKIHLKL